MSKEQQNTVRTKIVATLGPASNTPDKLAALLSAGVNVCRLNFSHGSLEDHQKSLNLIREWSEANRRHVAALGDLCGPKIRLSRVAGQPFQLAMGDTIRFVRGEAECTREALTISLPRFVDEVEVGHRIYIDDGLIKLLAIDRDGDSVLTRCIVGGVVSSRKGVNLPDTRLSLPALTDKDRQDAEWAIKAGVDYLALSFVRSPSDVQQLRDILRAKHCEAGIIAKIEKFEALEHLPKLVNMCDGLMVARGDLGVEMDVWQVPIVQKGIIGACRAAGKPVIVATQMLQSMVSNPMPTRAEVSDVANAILDSADAVMLSAETAAGDYPVAAVEMMQRVGRATEAYAEHLHRPATETVEVAGGNRRMSAIAQGAVHAASHLGAKLIAVWSATGETVRYVSQQRLPIPIVGLTYDAAVCRRMNLYFGVTPLRVDPISNPVALVETLDRRLISERLAKPDDVIIVVSSRQPMKPGETDTMLVHRVHGRGG